MGGARKLDEVMRVRLADHVRRTLREQAERGDRTEAAQIRRYVVEGLRRDGLLPPDER
jgi:hypothetical protein